MREQADVLHILFLLAVSITSKLERGKIMFLNRDLVNL